MLSPKFVLLSSALFLAGLPLVVSAENLDDAWRAALSANHRLAAQSESTAAAERQLDSARATRLPTLSIDASYYALDNAPSVRNSMSSVGLPLPGSVTLPIADDHGWVGQAGITQPLYTSGKISNGIRAAEAGLDAARADEGRERLDVKLSVAEAYLDVLRADAAQEVARQYVDSLEHHRRDVQALLDKGLVARADLLQVDV
ncbi:MAG: TolC family protein, partial [Microvirgula sp.]